MSRREFIKLASFLPTTLIPFTKPEFPSNEFLGRIVEPAVKIHVRPDADSPIVGNLFEDTVINWQREVVGTNLYRVNQRWIETPDGYLWAPQVQPVKDLPNPPMLHLPDSSMGPGMWVEVTVPYVEVILENSTPIAPRVKYLIENNRQPRLYFSQIIWVDQIKQDENGQVWYHLTEPYGSYGDRYWGNAEAFRPLTPEEISPINPEISDKRIEVNIARQTLVCFEEDREVYFCRISSGRFGQETPIGRNFQIYWKLVSVHMAAGSAGAGYDLTGVGWPTFFAAGGVAIHSTFWHNDFGVPTSAGCVNAKPDDAKFISRWTSPVVPYDPGVIDVGPTGLETTTVQVLEE